VRRIFIAGNWKMNGTAAEAKALAAGVAAQDNAFGGVEVAVCPPFVYLADVVAAVAGGPVGVGGQNAYFESSGAFTGEVSLGMLRDVGCSYVILGHSERRQIFGETDSLVNNKAHAAHTAGLTPIVCVGETLEEREAGQTLAVVKTQVNGSLAGLSAKQMKATVIAYEPVWAIGTGKVATPEQAQEVHADIRKLLTETFGADVAGVVRIQYGGSVKPDNAEELLGQADIDGALVGGASLKVESFIGIIEKAPQ